jgi:hypothetical protein
LKKEGHVSGITAKFPSIPLLKGGSVSPPFEKGRPGGI